MKKVTLKILLIVFCMMPVFACIPWSVAFADGFGIVYESFYANIKARNKIIEAKYSSIENDQIKNILIEFENKNIILNNMQNLSYIDDISKHEELFLLDTKKELKAILIDMWGEE